MQKNNLKTVAHILLSFMVFSALMCGLGKTASAQNYRNAHPFDFKRFNLGFLMGFTYNSYNLKEQINIEENGVLLRRIEMLPRPGMNLGMISNLKLHKQVSLRFIPTISLEQRDFNYYFEEPNSEGSMIERRKIEAAYLDMPLVFQLKTSYYGRTRVYVLAGANLGVNLASNKRVQDDPKLLKITTANYGLVFGFGLNMYGDRIKLSPEIVYKMGLPNIFVPEFTTHAEAISSLTSQVIAINFNFE
ncbi:MAG: PorT family protein [Bacteroidia bacterium]|nr:PorT family protein [Bacteroidia bacterium]